MRACVFVGVGGFVGAVCRYLISLLPYRGGFPALTLLTNFLGAVAIGAVVSLAGGLLKTYPEAVLFLKTGVCGGFTTFSTFSLETLTLLETQKPVHAGLYALLSVGLCVCGVFMGRHLFQ